MSPLEQLAQAHGFTLEQLERNRAGQLHPLQVARRRSEGSGWAVFFFVLAALALVAGVGGAAAFYEDLRKPVDRVDLNAVYAMNGGGVFIALCFIAAAVVTLAGVSRRRATYDRGAASVVQGPVQKIVVQQRRARDTYFYRVAGKSFAVPEAGWSVVEGGRRYRVYFAGEDLLSLEPE